MLNNTYKFKLQDDGRGLLGPGKPTLSVHHTDDGHQFVILEGGNIAPALSHFTVDGEPVRHEAMLEKLSRKVSSDPSEIVLVLRADLVEITQSTK